MIYAEALEREVGLLRWIKSPSGKEALARVVLNSEGQHLAEDVVRAHGKIVQSLERAEPYWWSSELTAAALTMAETLPPWTLRRDDPPDGAGFYWFSNPVPFDQGLAGRVRRSVHFLRAVSWLVVVDADQRERAGVVFTFWLEDARHQSPWPMYQWWWDVGTTWDAAMTDAETSARQQIGRLCRLVAASWALIGQRLFDIPRQRADRGAARRLKREGYPHEPLIRVVQLRRVEHSGVRGGEAEPVEWACRWVVSGHWRQQPYGPDQAQRRPTWISPYVKGPEDRPLKPPRATVFAVVR